MIVKLNYIQIFILGFFTSEILASANIYDAITPVCFSVLIILIIAFQNKTMRDVNNKTKTEDPINYMWISKVVDHYLPVSLFFGGFVAGLCVGLIVGST